MYVFIDKMGILGWPLVVLSVIAFALILNRILFFVTNRFSYWPVIERFYQCKTIPDIQHTLHTIEASNLRWIIEALMANRKKPKDLRDELISHLLSETKKHYYTGVRSLRVLAVISPMLGLLGTVIGMISAFHSIADVDTAVTPALIAEGLWVAMLTTAYGLAIALPCMLAAHLCQRNADRRIESYEGLLNHLSLVIEGIEISSLYTEGPGR